MTGDDELPSPASGLFLEVSFRRLLASCEDIVGGTSLARPDLIGCWQRSPVFHHYVEMLQEQLADLAAAAGSRLPRHTLEKYAQHVEALASQLLPPDLPAYCTSVGAQPASLLQQQPAAGALPRPAVVPPPVPVARTPQLQPAAKRELQGGSKAGQQPAEAEAATGAAGAAASDRAELKPPAAGRAGPAAGSDRGSRLQTQQALHEDLTEELAGMTAVLKSNTLAIQGRLKERGQLLDSTETALDTSVQKTKESKDRATQIHRRGRTNFCLTLLVMLIVGLAFAGMYVFIRMTRLAGYRAAVPMPAPAAPLPPPPPPPYDIPVYEQHYANAEL